MCESHCDTIKAVFVDIHTEVRHQQFHFLLAFLGCAVKQDDTVL